MNTSAMKALSLFFLLSGIILLVGIIIVPVF